MFKKMLILGILLAPGLCHGFSERSLWTISAGEECVIEFLSDDSLYCGDYCQAFSAVGRPDEIFVSQFNAASLSQQRREPRQAGNPGNYKVYVLNLKSKTVSLMAMEHFLQLELITEDFPVDAVSDYPELHFGGNAEAHEYVAPIQKTGKTFIATLSAAKTTSHRITFGIPNIIPFFGRDKWFQKEPYHTGTFFLEVFDKERPLKPIVQLQKKFRDLWLLPSIFELTSWTQGAGEPFLVVADNDSRIKQGKGRILLIHPRQPE